MQFLKLSKPLPHVVLPLPQKLAVSKYQLPVSTFLVLFPPALIVNRRVLVKVDAILWLFALKPSALVYDFATVLVLHLDEFADAVEAAVVELAEVGDSVELFYWLEYVDSHALHGILFPKADVAIPVCKDIEAVSVLDAAVGLAVVPLEVHKLVLLLHFEI